MDKAKAILNNTKDLIKVRLNYLKNKEILFFSIIIIGLLVFCTIYYIRAKLL